ncbi:unnamed protein product [Didymodactylos carnosus]|uniref:EGF-like domain-containing protein n=1 Tax=Didymodactylos carnosus TaxID=1234261 RepID=A0A813ST85_9BILA|nr:unnamed protein product [Didymodactylos carnosus]CAF3583786.1 unnamed protein product [Didymodactylos carnosus]
MYLKFWFTTMLLRSLSAYYVPDDIDSLTNTKSTCDCENGGTCILGAFCACPVAYTGRYCDTPVYTSCAIFKEYDIIETDCVLCICINSLLVCDVLPFGLCRHKRDNNQHLYRTKLIEIALNSIQQRFSQIRSFISAEKKNLAV